MITYVKVLCPACQKGLRVQTEYLGKHIRCNHCGHRFEVQPGQYQTHQAQAGPAAPPHHPLATGAETVPTGVPSPAEWPPSAEQAAALQELAAVRAQREQLLGQVEALEGRAERADQLEGELHDRRAEIERLGSELHVVRELLGSRPEPQALEAALEDVAAVRDDRDRLEQERNDHRTERDRLIAEHAALQETEHRARGEIERLEQELTQARQREEAAGPQQELAGRLEEALAEVERLREQEAALRQELESAQRDFEEELALLEGQVERHRREAAALRRERDELRPPSDEEDAIPERSPKSLPKKSKVDVFEQGLDAALMGMDLDLARTVSAIAAVQAGAAPRPLSPREQLEEAQRQFDQDRAALQAQVDQLRKEVVALCQERDELRQRLDGLE